MMNVSGAILDDETGLNDENYQPEERSGIFATPEMAPGGACVACAEGGGEEDEVDSTRSNRYTNNRRKFCTPNNLRKFAPLLFFAISVAVITTLGLVFTRRRSGAPLVNNDVDGEKAKTLAANKCLHELRYSLLGDRALRLTPNMLQYTVTEWMVIQDGACEANRNLTDLEQRYALLSLYFGMNSPESLAGWATPKVHECDWMNVVCNADKEIIELELTSGSGTLMDEFALLSSLTSLRIFQTEIQGTIPSTLFSLSNLVLLDLQSNKLTGTLSSEIGELSKLEDIRLGVNGLTGTLPSSFSLLSRLRSLSLSENELEGDVLSFLPAWPLLDFVEITKTKLEGTIPPSIGSLTRITQLLLSDTLVDGTIPTEIGLLKSLERFSADTANFQGSLPSEFGLLTSLATLEIRELNFTRSTLPTEIGLCTSLENLHMTQVGFSGTVPSELGQLTLLKALTGNFNAFTGTLPTELGLLSQLTSFLFENNFGMSGTVPTLLCTIEQRNLCFPECQCCGACLR